MNRISEMLWRVVAWVVTRDWVRAAIRKRAFANPYVNITSADGTDIYMGRWWLFNGYHLNGGHEFNPKHREWLPSIRLHHIRRADNDRHVHDHPWNARTIIMDSASDFGYVEERPEWNSDTAPLTRFVRHVGYTGRLNFGQYHRISEVPPAGVWTIFITWRKRGTWGFLVGREKVRYLDYFEQHKMANPYTSPSGDPVKPT